MSDFPEKEQKPIQDAVPSDNSMTENLNDSEAQSAKIKEMAQNENTTIFVKHVYNTKKPVGKAGLKRIMTCVVAVILCFIIGGSVFLINKLLPNDNNSTISGLDILAFELIKPSDFVKPSYVEIDGQQVEVESNIKSVSIYNYYEVFSFAPYYELAKKEETAKNSNTSSSDTESTSSDNKKTYLYNTKWRINGIDKSLTISSTIASSINSFLTLAATKEMENTFASVEEYHNYYGFDEPSREVIFEFNDGTEDLIITVGDQLPTGDANYLKLSTSDKVYIVASAIIANYDCLPVNFGNLSVIDEIERDDNNKQYFNDTADLARYDYITLNGSMFGDKTYTFTMSTGPSADFMPYMMNTPYHRPASTDFISEILSLAGDGLSASSLYAFSATAESLEICGFNNPKCILEVKIGDYKFKLIVGGSMTEDGSSLAVMVEGKPQIFKVTSLLLDFINAAANDTTKMLNHNFIMENITTIKSLTFTDSTGTHSFDLTHTKRTDSENTYDTSVSYKGATMDVPSFKSLYQRVLMMTLLEYTLEAEKTETVLKIEFNYSEGGSKTVELTKSPDDMYHYLAWVDGTVMGEVLKTAGDDVINSLAAYVSGQTLPEV